MPLNLEMHGTKPGRPNRELSAETHDLIINEEVFVTYGAYKQTFS